MHECDVLRLTNRTRPLKASLYNYFLPISDTTILGYNFLYRSIIRFPSDLKKSIDRLLNNEISENEPNQPRNTRSKSQDAG